MATKIDTKVNNRLTPRPGELIDRGRSFTFTFNGREYTAHPGDTIASALAANGVRVLSRSFKYHRPRGLLCCAGQCPNCLVQIGDEPNVRACTRPVESGMVVEPENAWPSLARDLMSLVQLGERFTPVGFYYKAFIRPARLWPTYEHLLRHAAGLGRINVESKPDADYDKQYLHTDVLVVGGGPAGLSAAVAAAEQGARVILMDENEFLGGHLRFSAPEKRAALAELEAALPGLPNLTTYTNTTVLGWWEDNWLAALQGTRLYKIRAGSIIFAGGAYEQPLLFDNNDRPGVMLGSAVQRLLHLYGVAPGRQALIVTANDDGWQVAADLHAAGVTLAAVADSRRQPTSPHVETLRAAGVPFHFGHTITDVKGGHNVRAATIAPVNVDGQLSEPTIEIPCDLVAVSIGWAPATGLLYQAGAKFRYDETFGEFTLESLPAGIFAAGRITGIHDLDGQLAAGRHAGQAAAAYTGHGDAAAAPPDVSRTPRTSALVRIPGKGKRFLCYCEDVTDKDLDTAIAEGYNSVELLKRYSTISMGPCQGRMCSLNALHLCARANGWTTAETGTTTARPPYTPVKMGVLAGQNMEPVRYTPVHDWHVTRGAKLMVAGLWLRPEHYGDPVAEVQAVRRRVGLIDVSTLGKMRLTGPGVPDLLDRIYVNKWQKLGLGRVRYGLMCNDEGIVLDDGVTARVGETEWYMTTSSSGAGNIYEWLQWWLQSGWGAGLHLANVTDNYAAFNLAGPHARDLLQTLTAADLSNAAFPYMHVRDVDVAGAPCRLLRIGFTGELSYELHCPAGYGPHLWQALMAAGEPWGILPFGVEAQRILRLEKGHIIVGQDTDALSNPLAADLDWAVKLDKADFLGRRSLLRIAEAGLEQRLVGFKMQDHTVTPEEGLQIVQPNGRGYEIIGWVTSSRYSPSLQESIGLCWLPTDLAAKEGNQFTIYRDGQLLPAVIHHGPFYDPAGERLRS